MSAAQQPADRLLGRDWPDLLDRRRCVDRRETPVRAIDIGEQRKGERRASMADTLARQASKADARRFDGSAITGFGSNL